MVGFPIYIHLGPLLIHPHWVFEALAYSLAFYWYRRSRRRLGDVVDARVRRWVTGAAIVGGVAGSRLLHLIEDPTVLAGAGSNLMFLLGGKTIVGGLIGGLIGVEWIKRRLGVVVATGDLLALPLAVGIAIGRVGCFLSGLEDGTFGVATRLPWGVNFGDGVFRHPTQLYEILFLVGLAVLLAGPIRRTSVAGDQFKLFMVGYMTFRLAVEFVKPAAHIGGLSVIQWACVAVLAYYAPNVPRLLSTVRRG